MKTPRIWIVPAVFLLVACTVNLYGCLTDNLALEYAVKGALLPMVALTGMAYLAPRKFRARTAGILVLAQLLGWAGDSLLMGRGFVWFASGLGAFLLGHICYICLFSRSLKGLSAGKWIIAGLVMAGVMLALIRIIGVNGAMLAPMAVYGIALLTICFSGLCGICRKVAPSRGAWWMVLLGALLFLGSDCMVAARSFGALLAPVHNFILMLTYVAAQMLLCAAGVRLAVSDKE